MSTIKFLLLLVFMILLNHETFGAPVRRLYQDVYLPSQQVLEQQTITGPSAAGTNSILNAVAGPTSTAAVTVTSFSAQPDVARNLVLTPSATTADVAGCTVAISGTDYFDASISENFVVADNQSTATTGNRAFKTVSSVAFPVNCEEGSYTAKWNLGVGEKIGLKRCLADAGDFAWSSVGGTYESTRATIATNSSTISLNTADFNGTMNGSNNFKAYFIQNFGCFP